MKKSGLLAAYYVAAVAASATAVSVSSPAQISHQDVVGHRGGCVGDTSLVSSNSADKFAPRFDGLRFIETLITAHR